MSLKDTDSDTSPADIMAAQDNFADSMREGDQEAPGSPTSDEWEVVPDQAEQSDCGSSAKSLLLDDSPANSQHDEGSSDADLPTLHLRLLPQGSSDVTVHLTAHHQVGPPPLTPLTPGGLSDSARQQYQEQLRKAQETMLPQSGDLQHSKHSDITEGPQHPQPHSGSTAEEETSEQDSLRGTSVTAVPCQREDAQGESFHTEFLVAAEEAGGEQQDSLEELMDADLPTSTHMSMQDDTVDAASPTHSTQASVTGTGDESAATDAADELFDESADAAADFATHAADDVFDESADSAEVDTAPADKTLFPPSAMPFPVYDSNGELSFMSDGSFINFEDAMSEEEAEQKLTQDELEGVDMRDRTPESVSVDELSQQADDLAAVARQLSEDISEGQEESCGAAMEKSAADDSQGKDADEEAEPHKYYKPNGFVASLQYRLGQLLSTIQAWTATAYASLPTSAAVYNSTLGVFGPKSPLRSLDKLHWSLASGLALVSAALGWYIVKNQQMQKQVTSSSTELSRLLLKVINLQQSLQSPGRVPIIRHTSSIASITPFPLTHLM